MKAFINPLIGLFIIQLILLISLRSAGRWRQISTWQRRTWWACAWLYLLLLLFSTPFGRNALEAGLIDQVSQASDQISCSYIFVLGGGYEPGVEPENDVLVRETQQRVQAAVVWWRVQQSAELVMTGAALVQGRTEGRMVELMAEEAIARGLPRSRIVLERYSENTRRHPVEALKLPNITPATPIGIVTSSWHARRSANEFKKHFYAVISRPVPRVRNSIKVDDFVPAAECLASSTTLLREYGALLWYSVSK